MIVVIFEAQPQPGRKDAYLDAAANLRPLLDGFDGFVSIERFASLSEPDKVLSLSVWRDEESVRQWRNVELHRRIQGAGRQSIFADYRLRVAHVLRDYGMADREQAPPDSRSAHDAVRQSGMDAYLALHFMDAERFASACGISSEELFAMVRDQLVPAPSYVVSESSTVNSHIFGALQAEGSTDGSYFRSANAAWVRKAQRVVADLGRRQAGDMLKMEFAENLHAAFVALDRTVCRLTDSFDADGLAIADGLRTRIESTWEHFLHGTYGLCVADPLSEAAIAKKIVLRQKLIAMTDDGCKTDFSAAQAPAILELIDAYENATMPFSPVDYLLSSRKHLVDDLRPFLRAAAERACCERQQHAVRSGNDPSQP
jgi:heme-degrading monooxygenase HmoA